MNPTLSPIGSRIILLISVVSHDIPMTHDTGPTCAPLAFADGKVAGAAGAVHLQQKDDWSFYRGNPEAMGALGF